MTRGPFLPRPEEPLNQPSPAATRSPCAGVVALLVRPSATARSSALRCSQRLGFFSIFTAARSLARSTRSAFSTAWRWAHSAFSTARGSAEARPSQRPRVPLVRPSRPLGVRSVRPYRLLGRPAVRYVAGFDRPATPIAGSAISATNPFADVGDRQHNKDGAAAR